jgi:Uncharacterized protein conserved in bacteria (DUF2188)
LSVFGPWGQPRPLAGPIVVDLRREVVAKRNVWTVPHPGGGWGNRLEGSSRFIDRAATKREAQAAGRERARRDKVEHIIQNKDGQIGQRNSYGHDPRDVPG